MLYSVGTGNGRLHRMPAFLIKKLENYMEMIYDCNGETSLLYPLRRVCSRPSTRKTKLKEKKNMKENKVTFLTQAAMIAAIYVVLTYVFAPFSFGEIQIRISEALTILPLFTPAAIPGLFIGCLIGNILGGAILPDIIFGSLATLLGAVFTWLLRGHSKFLGPVPPIAANTIIVPFVLRYGYGIVLPIPFMMLTVGIGEVLSCGVLGMIVYFALARYKDVIFTKASA